MLKVIYYRLKQIDFDQRAVYSNTVVLKLNDRDNLELLSVTNPFLTTINMMFSKPPAGMVTMQLFDLNGRMIYSNAKMSNATSFMELTMPALISGGNYILKIKTGNQTFSKIILKQ